MADPIFVKRWGPTLNGGEGGRVKVTFWPISFKFNFFSKDTLSKLTLKKKSQSVVSFSEIEIGETNREVSGRFGEDYILDHRLHYRTEEGR